MSARRRWLGTIIALLCVGFTVLTSVVVAMFWVGARAGGEQWLHNDSAYTIGRINNDIASELTRSLALLAHDPAVVAAINDRPPLDATMTIAGRWTDREMGDRFLFTVGGAQSGGDISCGLDLARAEKRGIVVCDGAAFVASKTHVREDAELWLLHPLDEAYVDRVADLTLAEVEIVAPSRIATSLRSIDDKRMPVAVTPTPSEATTVVRAELPEAFRGVSAQTVSPNDWPERGARSLTMLVDTRPIAPGVTVATMVPMSILTRGLMNAVIGLVLVAVALTALLALVASRLVRRYTNPLRHLEETAHRIAAGDAAARVVVEGDLEMQSVARSFNAMVEKLAASRAQLLQQEKMAAIGQLTAGVAHELNTPLQFIADNTHYVSSKIDSLSDGAQDESERAQLREEVAEALADARDGIARVKSIVSSMKQFGHPSHEQREPVSLANLIESAATISRNEWKYVADLDVDVDATLPAVPVVRDELGSAILNMIVNAAHAISERYDGTATRGRIRIAATRRGDRAEVRIADDGVGMPPEIRKRVFEPFFTTKAIGKGTGQGLAIAYAVIVDKHGGSIDVQSAPNEGTTFIFDLPLHATHSARTST